MAEPPTPTTVKEISFDGITLRVLPEFPNYGFSRDGRGFNLTTRKQIGSLQKDSGYTLCLLVNKEGRTNIKRRMHRMIVWAWTGVDPGDNDVDHINTIKDDNHFENLRVVSRAEHRRITHQANPGHQQRSAGKRGVPIIATHESTGEVLRFDSFNSAGRHFNVTDGAIRHHVTDGTRYRGWSFATEDLTYADEVWRRVENYPGLTTPVEVSSYGRIRTSRQPTYGSLREGYLLVGVTIDGVQKSKQVSEFVCWAFHGPRPAGDLIQVNHIDHNPRNNRPENLEWVTNVRNSQLATGTHFIFRGKDGEELTFYSENELLRSGRFRQFEVRQIMAAAAAGQPYKDWHVTVSRAIDRREERAAARSEDPNTAAVLMTAVPPVTRGEPIYECDLQDPRSRTPSMDMRFPDPEVERRPIPGYDGYQITEAGQIISHKQSGVLKTKLREGIVYANLLIPDGRRRYVDAALLVALAFSENPDPATYVAVCAANGNPYDRRLENLEWCTAEEYTAYRREMKKAAAAAVNDEAKADDA